MSTYHNTSGAIYKYGKTQVHCSSSVCVPLKVSPHMDTPGLFTCFVPGRLVLYIFYICLLVCLLVGLCDVTYIVAMQFYFDQVNSCFEYWVATMSSLAHLRVWVTEKQRQRRCNNAKLTETRNARCKWLLVMPTQQQTDWEWLPGESPGMFKGWLFRYETCLYTDKPEEKIAWEQGQTSYILELFVIMTSVIAIPRQLA